MTKNCSHECVCFRSYRATERGQGRLRPERGLLSFTWKHQVLIEFIKVPEKVEIKPAAVTEIEPFRTGKMASHDRVLWFYKP